MSMSERFWSKVAVKGPEDCWEWTAARYASGYGCIRIDGKNKKAHRISYEIHKGPIPDGLLVMHSCDRRHCVNPSHLSVGTQKQNIKDMFLRGREKRRIVIPDETIIAIRKDYCGGLSKPEIIKKYGIAFGGFSAIIGGTVRKELFSRSGGPSLQEIRMAVSSRPKSNSKLSAVQVLDIKKRLVLGENVEAISPLFGVSHNTIYKIKAGKTYSHISLPR